MSIDTYLQSLKRQQQNAAPAAAPAPPPPSPSPTSSSAATAQTRPSLYDLFPGDQALHDWSERATNKVLAGAVDPVHAAFTTLTHPGTGFTPNLAVLRAQRQQAEAQMSPAAKASADIMGGMASPLARLNPIAQGAAQQGLESASQGNDLKTIAQDTALGGATGGAAMAATSPEFMNYAIKATPGLVGLAHGGAMEGGAGALIGRQVVDPLVDKAVAWGQSLSPGIRKLAQQDILGGASSVEDTPAGQTAMQNLRNAVPNIDWNTASTALGNLRGLTPF